MILSANDFSQLCQITSLLTSKNLIRGTVDQSIYTLQFADNTTELFNNAGGRDSNTRKKGYLLYLLYLILYIGGGRSKCPYFSNPGLIFNFKDFPANVVLSIVNDIKPLHSQHS